MDEIIEDAIGELQLQNDWDAGILAARKGDPREYVSDGTPEDEGLHEWRRGYDFAKAEIGSGHLDPLPEG